MRRKKWIGIHVYFENTLARSLVLSCGFGEITNSGFLANNYTQAAWHPLSVSWQCVRQSVTSSSSWCPASRARLNAHPSWSIWVTNQPASRSESRGLPGEKECSGQACTSWKHHSKWFSFGVCDLFSLALHWHQATKGFLWPKELPAWENVLGKGDILPVLGLSTS